MEQLPLKIIKFILENYLPYEDIINCKLVCKNWYSIIVNKLQLSTIVLYDKYLPYYSNWFLYYKPIDCIHRFKIIENDAKISKLQLDEFICHQIKKVCIFNVGDCVNIRFRELEINKFENCEILEIINFMSREEEQWDLILPNLKVLNVENVSLAKIFNLYLPKLQNLRLNEIRSDSIKFHFPESIKLIMFKSYHSSNELFKTFKNLNHFYYQQINEIKMNNLLENLTKLKSIHFNGDKLTLDDLVKQKEFHKRTDLKIFYFGIEFKNQIIPNLNEFNYSSNYLNKEILNYIFNNYEKVSKILPFINYLDYNLIEDYFNDNLPNDLNLKLIELKFIKLSNKIKYENQLNKFLANLKTTISLDIKTLSLNQEFFNQLPINLPYIYRLNLPKIQKLDLNFIFSFKYLNYLSINDELELDFVKKYFSCFKFANMVLHFKYHNHEIYGSIDENCISIDHYCSKFRFSNLNEMILFIKKRFEKYNLDERRLG